MAAMRLFFVVPNVRSQLRTNTIQGFQTYGVADRRYHRTNMILAGEDDLNLAASSICSR
jgi:hypothetical protein